MFIHNLLIQYLSLSLSLSPPLFSGKFNVETLIATACAGGRTGYGKVCGTGTPGLYAGPDYSSLKLD